MHDARIPDALQRAPIPDADETVDASGLFCPIPIVRGAAALRKLDAGKVVHVIATDPGFVPDIQKWARHRTDELVRLVQVDEGRWDAWLRKG